MALATDAEIDSVREVAGENDFDFVSSLIDVLNDDQWARALDFLDAWEQTEPGDLVDLEGGREGVRLIAQLGLDDIRKRMRLLLGLPEERDASVVGGMATIGVKTEFRW